MTQILIDRLEQRLKGPLPGAEAHLKMKPILPSGARLRNTDPSRAHKSAVLLMLYQKGEKWFFPLIQRPTYDGVHSGQVALPGGRHEEEDQNLIQTALRESTEEIGVDQGKVRVIGVLSEFFVAVSNHLVLPVVAFYQGTPVFTVDPREVDHVIEAPLDQLMDKTLLKEKEITAASGYRLRSPYFEIEDKVVWGATAMMLNEFVHILNDLNEADYQ